MNLRRVDARKNKCWRGGRLYLSCCLVFLLFYYLLRPWFSVYRVPCGSSWNASCSFVVHIVLLHGYLIGIGQWGMTCLVSTPLLHRPHCRRYLSRLPMTNIVKKSYDLSHTRLNLTWPEILHKFIAFFVLFHSSLEWKALWQPLLICFLII